MPDIAWGDRDKRGEWQPETLPEPSPLFQWPLRIVKLVKYFFAPQGFLWPINLMVALISIGVWFFFTPGIASARPKTA